MYYLSNPLTCRSMEEEIYLADMHLTPGSPWEYCPRSTLKRLSGILEKEFGLVLFDMLEDELCICDKVVLNTLVICRSWKQALRLSSIFSNLGMLFYSLPIKEKEDIRTWIKYLTLAYGFAQHERYVGWPGQIALLFVNKLWCSLQHASWDIKYLGFTWCRC